MNPVNWFEIPVNDLERAKSFYESVLNIEMTITEMGDSLMAWFPADAGNGATGTLLKCEGYVPTTEGTVVYFSVASIENALAIINERGGETLIPKTSIGEHGFFAQFKDCEGNRVALHSGE